MPVLVQKYGGSSLADLEKLRLVSEKVVATKRNGYDVVVVVSAMGDTTDELLEMAQSVAPSPSRRELDMLLSVGERISMTLLSMAIHGHGIEAISLTGSQCGIITTDSHSNARIMDVRPFRVQDELRRGNIVIVAGYQGTSYRREVTTLGRGGSDTTAVALAAALGAEACEIYSDVDGVYSADPRVVLSAKKLMELSHDEMLEMARSGARVLNEQAVEFARRSNIALYAKATHALDSVGTVVRPDGFHEKAKRAEEGRPVVAVSHIDDGIWVRCETSAEHVMEAIADLDVAACDWKEARCSAFLPVLDLHDVVDVEASLDEIGDDVEVSREALVSAVGHGVGGRPHWARVSLESLRSSEVEPRETFIALGRLSWIVDPEQVQPAANALHAALVE